MVINDIVRGTRRYRLDDAPGKHRSHRRFFLNQTASNVPDPVGNGGAYDSFQSYTNINTVLGGLNGGWHWAGAYVDRNSYRSIIASDNFQSYVISSNLNELGAGFGAFTAPYVAKTPPDHYILAIDSFATYTTGSSLNGLSGGTGWTGSYADR